MPNNKQAEKRVRTSDKARLHNKTIRTAMRSAVKKVTQADSSEEAQKSLPAAMKKLDKAAKKGVIHQNAANRQKSRLTRIAAGK